MRVCCNAHKSLREHASIDLHLTASAYKLPSLSLEPSFCDSRRCVRSDVPPHDTALNALVEVTHGIECELTVSP
jgi:hypothetical protein